MLNWSKSLFIFFSIALVFNKNAFAQLLVKNKTAIVFATEKDSNRKLSQLSDTLYFKAQAQVLESEVAIFLDSSKTFQEMVGIGAAITDASAESFAKMALKTQKKLANDFFDLSTGIGYSLIRTNMNSCDFSSASYTYIKEGDADLKTFSIKPDLQFKIPLIKIAFATAENNIKLFASPWSPPAFMKSNNDMLHGGKLLPKYYQSWANYYVKFINAYENEGVPVWGLSIQNEPMATQRWESCIYTATEERDFLKNYLGPTISNANLASKKIIVWDHNRDLIFQRANVIFEDKEAAKYAWGIGFHWYETWAGGTQMFDNVTLVKDTYPDKQLIFTEGCKETFNAEKYTNWSIGEYYANAMIKDFNSGVAAWTDWNIFLDEKGGPNHVGNFCFAPVHLNTKTDEVIYTNAFYYLGHFSKFIRPGAKRIACSTSRSNIQATAFKNTDGKICVVVLNQSENSQQLILQLNAESIQLQVAAHAIYSVII
jgi:glucosylceramidase